MDNNARALEWNDAIEDDGAGGGYVVLPAGDYPFRVTGFERTEFAGSTKLPRCNQARLTIEILGADNQVCVIEHNFFLATVTEGFLCQFFRAIGARQHGERMVMNWGKVVGSGGLCRTFVDKFTGKRDGKEHEATKIKMFLDPPTAGAALPPFPAEEPTAEGKADGELLPF